MSSAMSAVGARMAARGGPGSRMSVMGDVAVREEEKAREEERAAHWERFEAMMVRLDAERLARWNEFLAARAKRKALAVV